MCFLILEEQVKSNSVFFLLADDSVMILMIILISSGRVSRGVRAFFLPGLGNLK